MRSAGNVTYQDRASAASKRLTYVNGAGHAIVKVDNATTLTRNADVVNRDSVRIPNVFMNPELKDLC